MRILPWERQNLQMILQKNQMEAYDAYVLLVRTQGCCGQMAAIWSYRIRKNELEKL